MKKRIVSLLSALLMLAAVLPLRAGASMIAPAAAEGYNEHDYELLAAFLEREDGDGVKNGTKLNSAYDVTDPATWTGVTWANYTGEDGKRVSAISMADFTGVTGGLSVAGCTRITSIDIRNGAFTSLNAAGCTAMTALYCQNNSMTSLDVTGCAALKNLNFQNNRVTSFSGPDGSAIKYFDCRYNRLTSITCGSRTLIAEGGGYVGYYSQNGNTTVYFNAADGYAFTGWYNEDGSLAGTNVSLNISLFSGNICSARFVYVGSAGGGWTVPEGYNAHDYNKIAAFFEQENEQGVKNGAKLNAAYDVCDPSTWRGVTWESQPGEDGMRATQMSFTGALGFVGVLDLSGCTYLTSVSVPGGSITGVDVSYCMRLNNLYCTNGSVAEVGLRGCFACEYLTLDGNEIVSIDVTDCRSVKALYIRDNLLTSIILREGQAFNYIDCRENRLKELELSFIGLDGVTARAGVGGYVGVVKSSASQVTLHANPMRNYAVNGWFEESGMPIAEDSAECHVSGSDIAVYLAKFIWQGDHPLGDVDCDGEVSFLDVSTLSLFLSGELGLEPEMLDCADVSADGEVTYVDLTSLYLTLIG